MYVYILYFFLFTQNKNSDFCAPLTSFDWNEVDPNLLGTSSIDTTCTIWGLEVPIIAFLHGLSQYCIVTTVELSLSTMDDLEQRHFREVKVWVNVHDRLRQTEVSTLNVAHCT